MTCAALCAVRVILFLGVWLHTSESEAQWQLAYLPFLGLDFPVSLLYQKLPVPLPEAIVGPLWWFAMPFGIWWIIWGRRRGSKVT